MRYLIFAIFLIGCSTATARHQENTGKDFASSWDARRCQRTLDEIDGLSWGLAFATGLTGVGGLSTAFPDDSKKDTRLALGISSAVLAAGASSMAVLLKSKRTQFSTYCNIVPEDAPVVPVVVVEKIEDPIPPVSDVYSGDAGIE